MAENATTGDVLVLGAGIVGVTTAYYLAQHGLKVTVIERQAGVGLETSFANGSLITPSMSDPWAVPGLPLKILKWLGREDAPFLVRPRALPGLIGWGLRFLTNCRAETWRRNTATIYRVTRYSQQALDELSDTTDLAYDRSTLGTLRLFRDPLSMESARRNAEVVGDLGLTYAELDRDACVDLEPALAPQREAISGAIHFPDDESGDAYKFTAGVAERCRDLGVEFRFGVTIKSLEVSDGAVTGLVTDSGRLTARHYVLALGSYSPRLLSDVGIKLPIYPVKGYSATLPIAGWNAAPRIPMVDDGRKIAIVRLGERLRLAGTAEFNGYDRELNAARGQSLIDNLLSLLPECPNSDKAEHWTGIRPMTPDGIPILGPSPLANLFLNVGHGHLGWTMACGSGRAIADLVAGRSPELDLSGMTLARFS